MTAKNQQATPSDKPAEPQDKRIVETVSSVTHDGHLIELVYDPIKQRAQLAHWDGHRARLVSSYAADSHTKLVPLRGAEALVEHDVVKFASQPADYGETADLVTAIRSYLHRYVDVPEAFERLAAHYVLLSWVHDRFNELPYLRRRGEYGTGKTRFLLVLGAICYKPIFAGAPQRSRRSFI